MAAARKWFIPDIKTELSRIRKGMVVVTREEYEILDKRITKLEEKVSAPAWFVEEFGSADLNGMISYPSFTTEGWRTLAVAMRVKKINSQAFGNLNTN
ncbi:hypothetical protein D3C76_1100940 [compost metagenome]